MPVVRWEQVMEMQLVRSVQLAPPEPPPAPPPLLLHHEASRHALPPAPANATQQFEGHCEFAVQVASHLVAPLW